MTVIRGVLFDYGMVLSGPPDPATWEHMRCLLRVEEKSFHAAYWSPRIEYDRGALDGRGFWRAVAHDLGLSLGDDEIEALLNLDGELWTQPNQPMIDWAVALQRGGVRTGILSNIGDEMEASVRARCPWIENFDSHIYSHRLKLVKPQAEIYLRAIEALRLPAEQVLFVDDREENIEAARAVGLQAIQYVDPVSFVKSLRQGGFKGLPIPFIG